MTDTPEETKVTEPVLTEEQPLRVVDVAKAKGPIGSGEVVISEPVKDIAAMVEPQSGASTSPRTELGEKTGNFKVNKVQQVNIDNR